MKSKAWSIFDERFVVVLNVFDVVVAVVIYFWNSLTV